MIRSRNQKTSTRAYAAKRKDGWWARVVILEYGKRREARRRVDVPLTPGGRPMADKKAKEYVEAQARDFAAELMAADSRSVLDRCSQCSQSNDDPVHDAASQFAHPLSTTFAAFAQFR